TQIKNFIQIAPWVLNSYEVLELISSFKETVNFCKFVQTRLYMNLNLYLICQLIAILLVFGLLSMIAFGLKHAFRKLRIRSENQKTLITYIRIGFILWLAILAVLSYIDFFQDFQTLPPKILLAIIPNIVLIFFLWKSRFFSLILKTIPKPWLVYVQSFRIIMEGMLWLGMIGHFVPLQMTFLWLNQDIIVGLTAVVAGGLFFRRRQMKLPAILWNIFGILLLINVFFIGMLSSPSPLRIFLNEPSTAFIANVPFIWIPGFIVPFALAMHVFSLKQLMEK
ncbi:MAG: hypothetical protein P1U70_25860, partial [Saprospiraceae bacterium]|nr:hypothetical protein [Saprospiraceae bacterium]